jgi:hypothetical protein
MSLVLKINGTDRSSWINWPSLKKTEGLTKEPDTLAFSIKKTPSKTIPSLGDTVELYENSVKIFKGTITERIESIIGGLLLGYDFNCKDPSYQFDKLLVVKAYSNMAADDIVKSIIDTFTTGFTYANVSAGSATISTIQFNYELPSQCIQKIADMVGWDWYVDYNNDIHFFDETAVSAPFGIDDTSGNLEWQTLSFDSNILELKNSIIVRGGQYAQTLTDTTAVDKYIADGTQRVFTNIYQYANVTVKKNTTVLVVGIDNIDDPATKDVLYNYTEKAIKFRDDNKPSNGDTVKIYGDAQIPLIVKVKDNVSVVNYGEFQHIEIDKTISSINEAKLVAKSLLAQWTQGSWQGSFNTTKTGLTTGMQIQINSPVYGINQSFKINRIIGTAIGNDRMEYTVNFLASGDTNFTDIMIGLLGQNTQNLVISNNEVLERLEDFTESMTMSDSLSVANITSGPYQWGSDPNPLVWNFGVWG